MKKLLIVLLLAGLAPANGLAHGGGWNGHYHYGGYHGAYYGGGGFFLGRFLVAAHGNGTGAGARRALHGSLFCDLELVRGTR